MKKIFLILGLLLFPQFAMAQTQRNPCFTTGALSTQGIFNCIGVGVFTSTGAYGPLPVGGVASATAPTFIEGLVGGLSFDLSGNLRVNGSFTPSGTQDINLKQIQGAVPSLTNPLWITPATGAIFSTTGPSTGGGFPNASTPITISATGTTAATVATLAATSGKTTYICGFSITSDATAGLAGNATLAGVVTGTMTYIQGVGVAPAVASLSQTYSPCIPASTTNTTIVITSAAAGVGGGTAINAWGYQQ